MKPLLLAISISAGIPAIAAEPVFKNTVSLYNGGASLNLVSADSNNDGLADLICLGKNSIKTFLVIHK